MWLRLIVYDLVHWLRTHYRYWDALNVRWSRGSGIVDILWMLRMVVLDMLRHFGNPVWGLMTEI